MAVLIFRTSESSIQNQKYEFYPEIRIGAAIEDGLRLPSALGVAPYHSAILYSKLFQVPVLVDLAGETAQTRVNGRRVTQIKVLHHQDRVELGSVSLEFWEIIVQKVTPDSPIVGRKCLVCYRSFAPGEQIIICPRCDSLHHRDCWLHLTVCSREACGYPVLETMRGILTPQIHFEELEEESGLVQEKQLCIAGNRRDQLPFKPAEDIAYCPGCETPFHVKCWFSLRQCPKCGYNVADLIQKVLVPDVLPIPTLQERSC